MKIKRVFGILLVCFLFSCLIQGKPVEAAKGDLAGEKKSDYVYAINDMYKKELLSGVMLYKQQVRTLYNGTGIMSNGSKDNWNRNTVQWVDVPASSEDLKVVVWSNSNKEVWKSDTVRRTALDYEETHPGWIVVAGINGDFFDIKGTGEPTNISVHEGEVWQPIVINNMSYRAELGFVGNDFTQYIYGNATYDSSLSVEIMKNGVVTDSKKATTVNSKLSETGINVLTKDNTTPVDLTGYKVLVGEYDIVRMSAKNPSKIFVKGTIVSSSEIGKVTAVPKGNFYLASKDGSLDNFVNVGDYVRCQHNLTGEWTNVTNAIGYIYQIMNNGNVLHKGSTDSSYPNVLNPHTFIGFKEDGSVVMMVVEGRGKAEDAKEGVTLFQGGELMRLAGCRTAFNLDGGGSSTLVIRNERGGLEVVNTPSDGNERSDGNSVLVVMRDPKVNFSGTNLTRTSVSFTRTLSDDLKNLTIKINNQVYDFTSEFIEITGLEENTEYEVEFAYEIASLRDETKTLKKKFKVVIKTKQFIPPTSGLDVVEIGKNSITINKQDTGYSDWIKDVVVYVSGTSYYMGDNTTFVIDDLLDSTKYEIKFAYNVVEPGNPKLYPIEEDTFNIKTLAFNLPVFEKLEIKETTQNSIKIAYEYDDEDRVIEEIYAVVYAENGKEVTRQKIEKKRGTLDFVDLYLNTQKYSIKLEVLYYKTEEDTLLSKYSSEAVTTEIVEVKENTDKKKTCKKSSGEYLVATLSAFSLGVLLIRRKK